MNMTDLSTEALLARRELAKKATPGPWKTEPRKLYVFTTNDEKMIAELRISGGDIPWSEVQANARYIAANDPPTVLADIDEILRLRADVARLEREADWLAQAAANNGWGGRRVSAGYMREAARQAVENSR